MMAGPTGAIRPLPLYAQAPILLLVIGFLMLQPLSTDLYLASLPSLGNVFGAPASTVQLTLSMFVIAFGGAQLVIGPLSDRYGRRPVVIWGLCLYVLASVLCALAPSIELLIVARETRSQEQNRRIAEERLLDLVRRALVPPKKRHATRPTRASRERRLDSKSRKQKNKRLRTRVRLDD